jgi:uncharacterized protein (DUF1330 family)
MASTADVQVLEGEWPFEGRTVTLERFSSMRALRDFWYSPEYHAAQELRGGSWTSTSSSR